MHANGALGQSHRACRLAARESLDEAKSKTGLLHGRQLRDRVGDANPKLETACVLERAWRPRRVIWSQLFVRARVPALRGIARRVPQNREEPGLEAAPRIEAGEVHEHASI